MNTHAMERHPEFAAFIRELMPGASDEELGQAMEHMDDYIRILMRIAERAEHIHTGRIRENSDSGV
jgi:hypothetical protein